jgi:hypothetical protein
MWVQHETSQREQTKNGARDPNGINPASGFWYREEGLLFRHHEFFISIQQRLQF